MRLEGRHQYNVSPNIIWSILMDPITLAKITPGISKLEPTGENSYDAIAQVKIGPVSGSFKGAIDLKDKVEPSGFTLLVKQKSKIGNVSADVKIKLNEMEGGCEVSFDGIAKLSGLLARTGQRVLSGVANTLSNQFFKALEQELDSRIE